MSLKTGRGLALVREPECPEAWMSGCLEARGSSCLDVRMPGCLDAWVPGYLGPQMPGCRVLECLAARSQDMAGSGWVDGVNSAEGIHREVSRLPCAERLC